MVDILVFGAGFAPSEVSAMPLSMIRYWANRRGEFARLVAKKP